MIFYENFIYTMITGYFFSSIIYETGDSFTMDTGLAGSVILLILTHYNEHLKRSSP